MTLRSYIIFYERKSPQIGYSSFMNRISGLIRFVYPADIQLIELSYLHRGDGTYQLVKIPGRSVHIGGDPDTMDVLPVDGNRVDLMLAEQFSCHFLGFFPCNGYRGYGTGLMGRL